MQQYISSCSSYYYPSPSGKRAEYGPWRAHALHFRLSTLRSAEKRACPVYMNHSSTLRSQERRAAADGSVCANSVQASVRRIRHSCTSWRSLAETAESVRFWGACWPREVRSKSVQGSLRGCRKHRPLPKTRRACLDKGALPAWLSARSAAGFGDLRTRLPSFVAPEKRALRGHRPLGEPLHGVAGESVAQTPRRTGGNVHRSVGRAPPERHRARCIGSPVPRPARASSPSMPEGRAPARGQLPL